LPDGSLDNRRLRQKVLQFGSKKQALHQAKPAAWTALEKLQTTGDHCEPYIVPTRPHYHLPDGAGPIPLRLVDPNEEAESLYFEPQPDSEKPGRFKRVGNPEPHFWLSRMEMMPLVFYHQLKVTHQLPDAKFLPVWRLLQWYQGQHLKLYTNIAERPETWISADKLELQTKLDRFFKAQEGFRHMHIQCADLPETLCKHLLKKQPSVDELRMKQGHVSMELLLKDGETRIETIKRVRSALVERISPGKRAHRMLRAGEMATFLAKDMLRFQPLQDADKAHQGKATSIMYDVLQARLAFFGRDKQSLPALMAALGLLHTEKSEREHPFLRPVMQQLAGFNGIAQFYEAYVHQRQKFLKSARGQLQSVADLAKPQLVWLGLAQTPQRLQNGKELKSHAEQLAQRLKAREPMNLPRGLFRESIVRALAAINHPSLKTGLAESAKYAEKKGRPTSVAHLVDGYMASVHADEFQKFYRLGRSRIKERIGKAFAEKSLEKHKALQRKALDLDQDLRQRAAQDQVLFLAAQQLLQLGAQGSDALSPLAKLKLRRLKRDDLNTEVPTELKVHGKTIYLDKIKAKNIGQFKQLNRDRRLPGLLHHYQTERIHWDHLRHELQAYPRAQRQAFSAALQAERQTNKDRRQASAVEGSLHGHLLSQQLQKLKATRTGQDHAPLDQAKDTALQLRNAFAHNELPVVQAPALQLPVHERAEQQLRQARQTASGVADRAAQPVAKFFVQELHAAYTSLGIKIDLEPKQPQSHQEAS
jgi:hypothetical protein